MRWMAPESLQDGVFTSASDVWAFGVLLWELLTFAKLPYGILTNAQVCEQVCEDDYRLPQPKDTPDELFALTEMCWEEEPESRKSFKQLLTLLSGVGLSLGPIRHKKDPERNPADWAPQPAGDGGGYGTGVIASRPTATTCGVDGDEYISIDGDSGGGSSGGYDSDDSFDGFSKLLGPDGEVDATYYMAADAGDPDDAELYDDTRYDPLLPPPPPPPSFLGLSHRLLVKMRRTLIGGHLTTATPVQGVRWRISTSGILLGTR